MSTAYSTRLTHQDPETAEFLMLIRKLTPRQLRLVLRYTRWLNDQPVEALGALERELIIARSGEGATAFLDGFLTRAGY